MGFHVRGIERKEEEDKQNTGMKVGMYVNWSRCISTEKHDGKPKVPVSLCRSLKMFSTNNVENVLPYVQPKTESRHFRQLFSCLASQENQCESSGGRMGIYPL